MATNTQIIRDYYNRIVGFIEEDEAGNKVAKDFYRRILGRYDSKSNLTKDFYNRIVARGDALVSLIYAENEKQQADKQKNSLNRK